MTEVKAPNTSESRGLSVFLAGSIEMGKAEQWQKEVVESLKDIPGIVYNPRRDAWDSSWVQSIDNPKFFEQVTWEYTNLHYSDVVFFYFDPNTKSPVTLYELGSVLAEKFCIVVCPKGYFRKGNVDIYCYHEQVDVYEDLKEAIEVLKEVLINLI